MTEPVSRAELDAALTEALGVLSLDEAEFEARASAVATALEPLTGNDCLWVLGAIVGSIMGQAPAEHRPGVFGGFMMLARYCIDREIGARGASRQHEAGHA